MKVIATYEAHCMNPKCNEFKESKTFTSETYLSFDCCQGCGYPVQLERVSFVGE